MSEFTIPDNYQQNTSFSKDTSVSVNKKQQWSLALEKAYLERQNVSGQDQERATNHRFETAGSENKLAHSGKERANLADKELAETKFIKHSNNYNSLDVNRGLGKVASQSQFRVVSIKHGLTGFVGTASQAISKPIIDHSAKAEAVKYVQNARRLSNVSSTSKTGFHIFQANNGEVKIWVRDKSLNSKRGLKLVKELSSLLHHIGLKLTELTINGIAFMESGIAESEFHTRDRLLKL